MSFSAYARQVRDRELPYRHRVSSLRSCVQLYRPIGFHATLSFLETLAGPFTRDETALIGALDALAASRAIRTAETDRYAAARTAAKRLGRRRPHPAEKNPLQHFGYWYGAPKQAALHALQFWSLRRLPDLVATDVPHASVVARLAAESTLTTVERETLSAVGEALQNSPWHHRTRDLLQVVRFIEVAADGLSPEPQPPARHDLARPDERSNHDRRPRDSDG